MEKRIPKKTYRSIMNSLGGGTVPKPGEISLAHNGVLFLDEFPEFSRQTMEVLRQPLEDGIVTISRVSGTLSYPCSITLVCAMNPCPCGYYGTGVKKCTCSPSAVSKYLNKISGPLLDRIDIHVEVPSMSYEDISSKKPGESSEEIRKRVNKARKIQLERFKGMNITSNSHISPGDLEKFCALDDKANSLLKRAFQKFGLTPRAYGKVIRVARTIADLDGSENIQSNHIAEAVQYRSLDRKYWNH